MKPWNSRDATVPVVHVKRPHLSPQVTALLAPWTTIAMITLQWPGTLVIFGKAATAVTAAGPCVRHRARCFLVGWIELSAQSHFAVSSLHSVSIHALGILAGGRTLAELFFTNTVFDTCLV